jgi:hypothetical protein
MSNYLRQAGLVHLQGVGDVRGKPVREFQPGEFMGWNYGYAGQVQSIEPTKGGKMALVHFTSGPPRKMGLDRLVAIASPKWTQDYA